MRRGKLRKFGKERIQRKALFRSLATALIEYGKIETTSAKAKSLSSFTDKIITTAKKQNLASKKRLLEIFHPKIVKKLINEIVPKLNGKKGGYTRVIRLGQRRSDGAEMAIIEFTS